jgi:MarR family transcriptional regulator, lower aerobic nicotinate degradation pathway regulator
MGHTNVARVGATNNCYARRVRDQPSRDASALRDRPTWLISRTYARSRALLNDGFADSGTGLRSYHYRLLAALEESGPTTQATLGRNASVDRSDVVNVLAELEPRGLVQRTVDPTNRRRNIVTITPAGRKQLRALDDVIDAVQELVLQPLTQTERRQLTKLLRKLADAG